MRKRKINKQIRLDEEENKLLKQKAKKVGVNESTLIRNMIKDYELKEKPDDRFYDAMRQMRSMGNSLNQIARKANSLNFIDAPYYKKEADKWNKFMRDIKTEFLVIKTK